MVEKDLNEDKKPPRNLLAKLWWGSIPVLIASQGLLWGQPGNKVAVGDLRSQPHAFWSVEDNGNSFSTELFDEAFSADYDIIPPSETLEKTQGTTKESEEIDWFADNKRAENRFNVPKDVVHQCSTGQDCRFTPGRGHIVRPCSNLFLCQHEFVRKVSSVASSLCSGNWCGGNTQSCDSYYSYQESPWVQGSYSGQDACPTCFSDKAKIPAFVCASHDQACQAKADDVYTPPSVPIAYSDSEWIPDSANRHTEVPHFVCVGDSQICSTKASQFGTGRSIHDVILTVTDVAPPVEKHRAPVPPLAYSQDVGTCVGHGCEGKQLANLSLSQMLAHGNGVSETTVLGHDAKALHLTDVPALLCANCDISDTAGGMYADCEPGACKTFETGNYDVMHGLRGFTTVPVAACDGCSISAPSENQAYSLAANEESLYRHSAPEGADAIAMGRTIKLEEATTYASNVDHLDHPLVQDTLVHATQGVKKPADELITAPSPTFGLHLKQRGRCAGECGPSQPMLTPDHPTIARAAFDGTGHDRLEDIQHLSGFGTKTTLTDPGFSSAIEPSHAVVAQAPSTGIDTLAPLVFWGLTQEKAGLHPRRSSTQPSANTSTWQSWDSVIADGLAGEGIINSEPLAINDAPDTASTQIAHSRSSREPWTYFDELIDIEHPSSRHIYTLDTVTTEIPVSEPLVAQASIPEPTVEQAPIAETLATQHATAAVERRRTPTLTERQVKSIAEQALLSGLSNQVTSETDPLKRHYLDYPDHIVASTHSAPGLPPKSMDAAALSAKSENVPTLASDKRNLLAASETLRQDAVPASKSLGQQLAPRETLATSSAPKHVSRDYPVAMHPNSSSSASELVGEAIQPYLTTHPVRGQSHQHASLPPLLQTHSGFINQTPHSSAGNSTKQLAASAQPSVAEPALVDSESAHALGLENPGLAHNANDIADKGIPTHNTRRHKLGQSHNSSDTSLKRASAQLHATTQGNTAATALLTASEESSQLAKSLPHHKAGSEPLRPPVCAERHKDSSYVAGETQKPGFDYSQLKQLTASTQPGDHLKRNSHPAQRLDPSPGMGSQLVTADGVKVPGGLDIPSGHTGVRHNAPAQESTHIVKAVRDGSYHVTPYASPQLNTTNDHLGVSGMVTAPPGTTTSAPWVDEAVNLHGKDAIGLQVRGDDTSRSDLDFQPSLGEAWGVDKRRVPEAQKIEASVDLRDVSLADMADVIARSQERSSIGERDNKYYKVVHVTDKATPKVNVGKATPKKGSGLHRPADDARERFSVEVFPSAPTEELPSMHQLLGRVRRESSNAPDVKMPESFLIGLAHADTFEEVGASSEDSAFYSVGASSRHHHQSSDWDEESRTDSWSSEQQTQAYPDAGLEKPMTLGVRREGFLWSDEGPWLDNPSSEEAVSYSYEESPNSGSPPGYTWSEYSPQSENTETAERELNSSLQKKNRSKSSRYEEEFAEEFEEVLDEGEDYVTSYSEAYFSEAAPSEQADAAAQESGTPGDHTLTAKGQQGLKAGLDPFQSTRDLAPRSNLQVAQETLFESGAPATRREAVVDEVVVEEDEEEEDPGFTINFRDVPITEYIRFVSGLTGQNFIFNEEELDFSITVISDEPTTVDNIMAALLQELRIHGLSVLEQGNNIIIHKSAARSPAKIVTDDIKQDSQTRLITRVFQLDAVDPEKLRAIVEPMLSGQALVQVLPDTKNLLVTDLAGNVEKIADLIKTLDLPATTFEIGQYVGLNNFIENLIPLAEEIVRPIAEGQNLVFVPHLATNSVFVVSSPLLVKRSLAILQRLDALEGQTNIMTLDELSEGGAHLVRQKDDSEFFEEDEDKIKNLTPEEIEEERRLREERDREGSQRDEDDLFDDRDSDRDRDRYADEDRQRYEEPLADDDISQTKFFIHKLRYRKGDQLTDALYRISDSLRLSEKANIDLINAINSIQWIESSNSLVVTGTPESLGRVKELVEEIDTPLRQVFLEMLVLDTTISDSLDYSVEWTSEFSGVNVGGAQGWSGATPLPGQSTPLLGAVDTAASGVTTDSTTGALTQALIDASSLAGASIPGFNLGVIGRRVLKNGNFFNTMGALVRALHTDVEGEVIINPKIIVEDNHEAEIFVGENTAYQTQNTVNDSGEIISQNVEYRDIGTLLRVRPQIGTNNVITLEIEQEVSQDVSASSGGGGGGGGGGGTGVVSNPGPTTKTSRTITKVHVPNGFFVILSGMVREEKQRTRWQLPCLGGIPIIGAANSRRNTTLSKRNLMIFIRPQIIETEWDFDAVTQRNQNQYKDTNRRKPRWKYEVDEGLEFLNLPRINERCEDSCYLPGYADDWGTGCDCD